MGKRNILEYIVLSGLLILAVGSGIFQWNSINSYSSYNTETLQYVKAKVLSVEEEQLEKDEIEESMYVGTQQLELEILEGRFQGTVFSVSNYLTRTHNIKAEESQILIVCIDAPENCEAYVTVYSTYRVPILCILFAVFALAVLAVGREKGMRALLGLVFSVYLILNFTLQGIYHGFSPVVITLLTIVAVALFSLVLLNGISGKTMAALLSTGLGVLCTGVLCQLFSYALHISGYSTEAGETLILVRAGTGLSVGQLLFAGILIASLGAVMDVAMSIASALQELEEKNPYLSAKELYRSGINIGQDMIGTMSNTLILAYVGSSLTTMLALMSCGYKISQLINSNYVAIEALQGIASTFGVVLTVPLSAAISAFIYKYHKGKGEKQ